MSHAEVPPIIYQPVGIIRREHIVAERTPIQPAYARGCRGQVEIFPEFEEGDVMRGIFATRMPCRPNAISWLDTHA